MPADPTRGKSGSGARLVLDGPASPRLANACACCREAPNICSGRCRHMVALPYTRSSWRSCAAADQFSRRKVSVCAALVVLITRSCSFLSFSTCTPPSASGTPSKRKGSYYHILHVGPQSSHFLKKDETLGETLSSFVPEFTILDEAMLQVNCRHNHDAVR